MTNISEIKWHRPHSDEWAACNFVSQYREYIPYLKTSAGFEFFDIQAGIDWFDASSTLGSVALDDSKTAKKGLVILLGYLLEAFFNCLIYGIVHFYINILVINDSFWEAVCQNEYFQNK